MNGLELGKIQREGYRSERTAEYLEVVERRRRWCKRVNRSATTGREGMTCEEALWRNCVTMSESQTAIIDIMSGSVTPSSATKSKCPPWHDCNSSAAGW